MKKKNLEIKVEELERYREKTECGPKRDYGPTTPEEVDERKERPWLYQGPSEYHGPTTPEEVDERKERPWLYESKKRTMYDWALSRCKWPDD